MSTSVHTCKPRDSLATAKGTISAFRVRRLTVVDEANR
jgi:CBS domain-containing protein